MQVLARLGLFIEVRNGDNCSVLVLVKAGNDKRFNDIVYRSRCVILPRLTAEGYG